MPRVDPFAAPSRCARCSAPLPAARAPSAADAWPASGARCRRGRRPIRRTGAPHDPENVPGPPRGRMTHQPQMQAHRHHAGPLRAFAVQHVERVLQVFKEILARGHAAADELGVVVGQAIGQHQMRAAIHLHVVGQLVVVGVGVVQEAAFLGHQHARVDAGTVAAIPAQRTRADRGLDRGDGAADALALFGLGQRLVALPAPAVRTRPSRRRGWRRRPAGCVPAPARNRRWWPACRALAAAARRARSRRGCRTRTWIRPPGRGRRSRRPAFGQRRFRGLVAVRHGQLAAFFVVDAEVQRDAGVAGPSRVGQVGSVADEVAPQVGMIRLHERERVLEQILR